MDRLSSMELLIAIVAEGSLSAAARRRGQSAATVVRALAALERRLGTRLLERTTRRIRLTEAGAEYLEKARDAVQLIEEAEAGASRASTHMSGRLSVSAPRTFGRLHVAPVLLRLQALHPGLRVRLTLNDRVIDLLDEGVDLAVRIGILPDSTLGATAIDRTPRVVCASPDYLRQFGTPQTPGALAQHRCLAFLLAQSVQKWSFRPPHPEFRPSPHGALCSDSVDVLKAGAIAGLGLIQVLGYQVARELETGRLVEVLQGAAEPPLPIHVVTPHARMTSAKVRAFREALAAHLSTPASGFRAGAT